MKVYYEKDADLSLIKGRKVTIVGYGSQGHAHAQNLNDSGIKVTVGLRKDGASWGKAKKAGLKVAAVEDAVQGRRRRDDADARRAHRRRVQGRRRAAHQEGRHARVRARLQHPLRPGRRRARTSMSVMIAPKAPGHTVRSTYVAGGGVPMLIAVHQDASKKARDVALSYAAAIGGARAGVIETNFREETETDLFGEQAVLCGGLVELIKAGYETLIEAGYAPEMAYFECLHEVKLIVDLIYEGGIANMNYSISNNAEYGEYVTGPKIVTDGDEAGDARGARADPDRGEYARDFILENRAGAPTLRARRRLTAEHSIEQVGAKLRSMMPWISKNKLGRSIPQLTLKIPVRPNRDAFRRLRASAAGPGSS